MAFARKTGDIAVLSATDLSVIALTYQWEVAENGEKNIRTELGQRKPVEPSAEVAEKTQGGGKAVEEHVESNEEDAEENDAEDEEVSEGEEEEEVDEGDSLLQVEEITKSIDQVLLDDPQDTNDAKPTSTLSPSEAPSSLTPRSTSEQTPTEAQAEEEDESDGGEWITPSNVAKHRSHDLGLLPTESGVQEAGPIAAACMTGDFAVQNVLLGMGLGLVGEGGKRINKVKSFILRCHACFK